MYVFDDENYDIFKRCGGSRQRDGAEICVDWEADNCRKIECSRNVSKEF